MHEHPCSTRGGMRFAPNGPNSCPHVHVRGGGRGKRRMSFGTVVHATLAGRGAAARGHAEQHPVPRGANVEVGAAVGHDPRHRSVAAKRQGRQVLPTCKAPDHGSRVTDCGSRQRGDGRMRPQRQQPGAKNAAMKQSTRMVACRSLRSLLGDEWRPRAHRNLRGWPIRQRCARVSVRVQRRGTANTPRRLGRANPRRCRGQRRKRVCCASSWRSQLRANTYQKWFGGRGRGGIHGLSRAR